MSKRLVVLPGVVLVLVVAALGSLAAPAVAGAADRGPLAGLRAWGDAVADGPHGDRQLARAARTLDARVPRLARQLRNAPPAVRSRELIRSQRALARSLDPVFARLPRARAFFLALRYQRSLEQLAQRADLDVSPTGLVRPGADRAALAADSDHDGVLDLVDGDDDDDEVPDRRDPSDAGWGIPDALQAREDFDADPAEDGRGGIRHDACLSVGDRIPGFVSVRAAGRALNDSATAGACDMTLPSDPSPSAPGDDGVPVCDRPLNPPDRDHPEQSDQDGDGAYDLDELRPYTYSYTLADGTRQQRDGIRTDPCDANSDHDSVTIGSGRDAVAYALGDGAERQAGTSDPTAIDGDRDGLPDVDELLRWGTRAGNGDTDGDGLADRAELTTRTTPPFEPLSTATSPTLRDTDGDSFSDADELTNLTNPLIAQVPAFDVRLSPDANGVQIAIDQATDRGTVTTRMVSDTTASSSTDQQTDTNVHVNEKVFKEGAEGGCSKGGKDPGCSFKVSFGAEQKIGDTITHSSQTTISTSSQRQVQDTYQESLTLRLKENGRLSATFQVTNGGDVALAVSRLTVLANAICLPSTVAAGGAGGCLSPRQVTTIATLAPVDNTGTPISGQITLGPGDSKTFQFAATVATPILQNVMANPGNLVFTPASYELLTPDGSRNYTAMIANALRNQAATLTIDYGDGRVERAVLATNVGRAWGAPAKPVALGATAALDVLRRQDEKLTYRVGDGGTLQQVRDKVAQPRAADGRLPGAWAVAGTGQGMEASTPFAAARVIAGDRLTLAYLADADADGLFDRQERSLGTSDTNPDSDGDGAAGPRPREQGGGTYASDYFEALVGWRVPFPDETGGRQAYASPVACDADGDGSPDGAGHGSGCPQSSYGPESERRTDPTNRDTNANGLRDGDDPRPLERKPTPVSRGRWRGEALCSRAELRYDGNCLVSTDVGATISTPALTLCATGSGDPACAGVSGYYRAQTSVGLEGCGTPPVSGEIGSWSIASGPTRWLDARLSVGEPTPFHGRNPYKLYFQVLGDGEATRLSYTHALRGNFGMQGCPAIVDNLSFEPISREQYLRAAYTADRADPDFEAIAVPARALSRDDRVVTPDGVQGLRIDQAGAGRGDFTGAVWGPGVDLPPGAWRAEFLLRASDAGTDEHALTPAVTAGKTVPAQEQIAATTGGMPAPTADRHSLVAGHVFHKDLPPTGAGQPVDLLFDQRGASQAASFPISVSPRASGAFMLDRVVIDRTPDVLAAAEATTYHGLGLSGWSRVPGLMSFNFGWPTSELEPQSLRTGAGTDRMWTVRSPRVPTAGRYVRWNTLFQPLDPNYGSCDYGSVVNLREDVAPHMVWPLPLFFDSFGQWAEYAVRSHAVRGLGDFMTDARGQTSSRLLFGSVDSCPTTDLHQFTLLNRPRQGYSASAAGVAPAGRAGSTVRGPAVTLALAPPRGATHVEISAHDDFAGDRRVALAGSTVRWRVPASLPDGARQLVHVRYSGDGIPPHVRRTTLTIDRAAPAARPRAQRGGGR